MNNKFLLIGVVIFLVGSVIAFTSIQEVRVNVLTGNEFTMNVYSPEEKIYDSRRVPFNISIDTQIDLLEYINYNDNNPRFRRLCRDCDEYGFDTRKIKNLNEGENNISIRGTKGEVVERENILLLVDSKDPKILKTEPRSGFSLGDFRVEFREDNPKSLIVKYGNNSNIKNSEVDLNNCFQEGNNMVCETNVDVSEFDGQEINYWFELTDILDRIDISKVRSVMVDLTSPILNDFEFNVDRRRVEFFFDVTEINFDEISYVDYNANRLTEKTLCSSLRNGICRKKIVFGNGEHNLTITILDQAGNFQKIEDVIFEI